MAEALVRGGIVGRIYGNLGRLLGGKAAAGLISLAYLAITARALGPADYGVLVLVHGYVLAVGGVVGFPGWHAVVRYGAEALENDDQPRLARLLRLAGLVEALGAMLAIGVAAALAPVIGPRLGWSPTAITLAAPYSLAVLASMRATPAGYLQLVGRFDILGLHNLVAPLVRLAGAVMASALNLGLRGFLIAWLAAALAEWAAMWLLGLAVAWRRMPGLKVLGGVRNVVGENPGLWRFMVAANTDITFTELAGRLTPLAVGWVLGPAAAGLYAVAQRATTVLSQPAQILGQAAYAEMARLVAGGGRGRPLRRALGRCIAIALLAALPVLMVIEIFGQRFAVVLGGHRFAAAASVMIWLAAARTIGVASPPISAALTAIGRPNLSVIANVTCGLGALALLPPMLAAWGLQGAGFNAILQALAVAGLLAWFIRRESAPSETAPNPAST